MGMAQLATLRVKQNEVINIMLRDLPKTTQAKLREHSKAHKGGMRGKHMKNMIKFMSMGDSFAKAHSKAKKLD